MIERRRTAAVSAAILLALNLGLAVLAIGATAGTRETSLWWPGAGIGALTLLVLPRAWWRWLVPALTGTVLIATLLGGRHPGAAVSLSLIAGLCAVLVAWTFDRLIGPRIQSVADFVCFVGVALVGAGLGALGVATVAATMLGGQFVETFGLTLTSHLAAYVVIVPLGTLPRDRIRGSRWVLVPQVLLLLAASLFAFGPNQELRLGFVPLLFLMWAAIAFECRVVAFELAMVAALVTTASIRGWGPFESPAQGGAQVAHLYLVSLSIAGLTLALASRQQRLASEAEWAEKRRTEAVVESTATLIMVTDEDGVLLSANPAVTAATGYPAQDLIGRPFWEAFLPPALWDEARARFADAPLEGRAVIRTASGSELMITYTRNKLVDPISGDVNFVLTGRDVTAERETSAFLRHLLRSASTVAIVGTDLNGAVTLVNAGAERMLRISENPGQQLTDFLDATEINHRGSGSGAVTGFDALVHDVTLDAPGQTLDLTWIPPEGSPLRVSMTMTLVTDARRRPIGYLFVARDVTDTRRNQELLHQALERERAAVGHLRALDRAKDDFVSTVSHELRTPLTSIIGSIELLSDGSLGDLGAEQKHLTEVIERNAERLLILANDLLLLAAYEGSRAQPFLVKLDLRDVVTASEASILPLLNHRDLDLRVALPADPIHVLGDADYLERAITNLLTNAIKFTPDGGTITTAVEVDEASRRCSISIADSGIGIPAADLANVFQRFFRSSNVRADAIQGTGLGLPIVRSVVESHHGSIEVSSQPGEGTTFTINLPLA